MLFCSIFLFYNTKIRLIVSYEKLSREIETNDWTKYEEGINAQNEERGQIVCFFVAL